MTKTPGTWTDEYREESIAGFLLQRRKDIIRTEITKIFGKPFNELPATKRKRINEAVQNIVEALDGME
jgi:hypothetical protein